MPKLADLCLSVNNSSGLDGAWYVKFAFNLGMDIPKARELFDKYGCGNIYTPTSLVMLDTPYNRRKLVANFGACVVVEKNGEMWVRKPSQIGTKNRKRAAKLDAVKRGQIRHAEQRLRVEKSRERMFDDCKGNPQSKRGGKANSHADIGKYVNFRGVRMESMERSVVRFAQISVNF